MSIAKDLKRYINPFPYQKKPYALVEKSPFEEDYAQRFAAKFRGGTLLRLTQIYTKHLINRIIFRWKAQTKAMEFNCGYNA